MKKLFKIIFFLFLLVLLAAGGYFIYLKYFVKQKQIAALNAIPSNAFVIIRTDDLYKAYDNISRSQLWQYLVKTKYFADIQEDFNTIDKYIRSTSLPKNFFNNRPLLASIVVMDGKWDMLYVVDIKQLGKASNIIEQALYNIPDYKTFKTKFSPDKKHSYTIYKMVYLPDQYQKIYISITDNLLIISMNKAIIRASLSALSRNLWKQNPIFMDLLQKENFPSLLKIYVNFRELDDFIRTFQIADDPLINELSNGLTYAVLNLNIKDNLLSLEGSVAIDTSYGYFSGLNTLKPGQLKSYTIMSDQAAAEIALSFNDYTKFYHQLLNTIKKQDPRQAYEMEKAVNILKKTLNINIEQDIFSWIGKEIALYKLTPEYGKRAQDIVITIHTSNPILAKEKLDYLTSKINKITPLKFKEFDYKGFKISYLKINGFFKLFFGKLFNQIEKPYFTIIENFVVFSNSPITLEYVIDDYLNGYTLVNNEKFNDFMSYFSANSTLYAYINMPLLFKNMIVLAPPADKKNLLENKDLITGFSLNGLQLIADKQYMKIKINSVYDPDAKLDLIIKQTEKQAQIQNILQQIDSLKFKIKLNDSLPTNGNITIYYPNTTQPMMQGEIRNGQPFGLWKTFYPDGNIKTLQAFDQDGKLNGIVQIFYDNKANSKLTEFYIKDDKINGVLLQYYPSGQIKAKIEYKNGQKHGHITIYYPDGKIKVQGKYKNGQKHGRWIFYDKAGNKISEEKWKNGQRR